jgi:RNA polymerase sigma factor (sigma-70 family)
VTDAAADIELLERWRAGDLAAADVLVARHFAAVARVFRFKVDDALDDLVQQTFLACVERRDAVAEPGKFRSYLLRIAFSLLHRHFEQRAGPRGRFDPISTSLAELDGESPSTLLAIAREHAEVVTALRSLPLQLQLALELFYWHDMTAADIAEVLDVPEGTVRSRLRLGRERLRERLEALGPTMPIDLEARARSVRDAGA